MYDIVFISYKERHAENNWEILKAQFPIAKRVKDVEGIHQAPPLINIDFRGPLR